jgi:integrase
MHCYKAILYVPGTTTRKTKILRSTNYQDAIKEVIDFRDSIRNGSKADEKEINREFSKEVQRENIPAGESKSHSLVELMARYVDFLSGDPKVVPEFKKKIRSRGHLYDTSRTFKQFAIALKKNNYSVAALRIDEIGDAEIGKFHQYLLTELKLKNSSYNKAITIFVSFYNYLINEGYQIRNPFLGIPKKSVVSKIETISSDEYEKLLAIVQKPELGIAKLGKGVKKFLYKPFVKDAIELGLHTGRRNEEIARMQWKELYEDEKGNLLYLKIQDFKINRQRGSSEDNLKFIYVPITNSLKDVLIRLGYEKYKGSEKYVLAPEEKMERQTIAKFMSRSFTHYYDQLGTGKNLVFKCLRKTYISELSNFMGIDNARLITKHSGIEVMQEHYVDQRTIAKTAQGFKMFDQKKNSNKNELEAIRKKAPDLSMER